MINQPFIVPIRDSRGKELYRLEVDWAYVWYADGVAWRIRVPAGFVYDGASVPRVGSLLLGIYPDGLQRAAALVHDYFYRHRGLLPAGNFCKNVGAGWEPVPVRWTRAEVDKLFANMLAVAGVGKLRRRTMYLAVRAAGWLYWKGVLR
jgi:hypothetical protein